MKPEERGKVIPMVSWQRVREAYERMMQMGWQSVEQAIRVGEMLNDLKRNTPYREFQQRAADIGIAQRTSSNLMRIASHRALLEKMKPDSQRAALALIPSKRATKAQRIAQLQRRDKKIRDQEEREEAERAKRPAKEVEEEHRSGFYVRAWNARQWADAGFGGKKIERGMIDEARACAAAWSKLADQLQERLT
jgi:hypothetical protein